MRTCYYNEECRNTIDSVVHEDNALIYFGEKSKIGIKSCIFEDVYGYRGFRTKRGSEIYIENCVFFDNYYEGGFFSFGTNDETKYGKYQINDSEFIKVRSPYGGIVNIEEIGIHSDINCKFFRCYFERNSADFHGGIIYSLFNRTNRYITFENCTFHENFAKHGDIFYGFTQQYEPIIRYNLEELKEIDGAFVTNPVRLEFTEESPQSLILSSGDTIPNNIQCYFVDDYDNVINTQDLGSVDVTPINDIIFFSLEVDDSYNVGIVGSSRSFCWNGLCTFPAVKSKSLSYLLLKI
ncbi:hypothetical protein PIROE2DRAFT_7572 [Piromyces sp. E2]|nr:hypothetical protein PIROE2DRAFT_7572 [Piromyces sp. E2]|eukprot:OUM65456.1 hypothetical protein PIROE2DRAFT_7572 [Piromyces sp. E2]